MTTLTASRTTTPMAKAREDIATMLTAVAAARATKPAAPVSRSQQPTATYAVEISHDNVTWEQAASGYKKILYATQAHLDDLADSLAETFHKRRPNLYVRASATVRRPAQQGSERGHLVTYAKRNPKNERGDAAHGQ